MTNLEEYRAGTNPTNALSSLRLKSWARTSGNAVALQFLAVSNRTHSVQFRDAVEPGAWHRLADVVANSTNREIEIIDSLAPTNANRFYRLVTPRAP